ncbi:MAG TPA: prenyltransferase/squalene oxidase repeat-containing protein, partial [Pirellulales bacterium]|nr:prenyltransferase/squalene oxidase repeat-containing protein [Pirellulales bacterium]
MLIRPARADIDAEQVRKSIDLGIGFLLRQQAADGTWTDHPGFPTGVTALCTLALLTAGVPASDPNIQKALIVLRKPQSKRMTYTISLQTMVLCAAEPNKDKLLIRQNVRWLEEQQIRTDEKKGAWGYGDHQGSGDNSNTQFALLALHEAERVGVPVSEQTWRLALGYWQRTQNIDGSWGYMPGLSGTGSMTCAGIAALVIAGEKLNSGDATYDENGVHCCGDQQANTALERA